MRFPRLKIKYDSSYKMWKALPTDAEYEKLSMQCEIDKVNDITFVSGYWHTIAATHLVRWV